MSEWEQGFREAIRRGRELVPYAANTEAHEAMGLLLDVIEGTALDRATKREDTLTRIAEDGI